MRLCEIFADRYGDIVAAYHASPTPLLRMPPYQIVSMVYAWAVERVQPDGLNDWLTELRDLLPWQDVDSEAAAEMESASFMSMMAKG